MVGEKSRYTVTVMEYLQVSILATAEGYFATLPTEEQIKISADITRMQFGQFESVYTKQLKGAVRELLVTHHRILYFIIDNRLYVVSGFRKKTSKTPKAKIEYAEKIYKILK